MNLNFKTAISSLAPTLAAMLGGPLAGTAVTALETALGLAPGSGADGITSAVSAGMTPEQIAAVRAADQAHAEKLRQMDIDVARMNSDFDAAMVHEASVDRASARDRETKVGGWTTPVLAWVVVGASLLVALLVMTGAFPTDPTISATAGVVMGYVFGEAKTVLAYYFGSSAGSRAKDETIATQAKTIAP